jgi:uroporphyrinogen decarboxylase
VHQQFSLPLSTVKESQTKESRKGIELKERTGSAGKDSFLSVLRGEILDPPPIWMMRQAGRYLPEYRQVRAKAGGFVELCLDPKLAAEVTLQPTLRFGLDAAIIFSDILIVPHALGAKLWFEENEGPRLEPLQSRAGLDRTRNSLDRGLTDRVYEALARVRSTLDPSVGLIGFCGAPWTVATYWVAGQGTKDHAAARDLVRRDPQLFGEIIARLVAATAEHLIGQIRAGADAVQIFDTWAGALEGEGFEQWCLEPTVDIVRRVRKAVPGASIILFPKGVSLDRTVRIVQESGADAVSLGVDADRKAARKRLDRLCVVQGNLDPEILVAGGGALDHAVDAIREDFRGMRHIFNLGHGILPQTPIAHVERMIARVRSGQ